MVVMGGEDRESKSFPGAPPVAAACGLLVFPHSANKTSCFPHEINPVKSAIFL